MVDSVVDKLVADAEYFVTVDVETIAGSSSDTSRTSKLYTLQIKKKVQRVRLHLAITYHNNYYGPILRSINFAALLTVMHDLGLRMFSFDVLC